MATLAGKSSFYRVRTNHGRQFRRNAIMFSPSWQAVDASKWSEAEHRNLLMTPCLDVEGTKSLSGDAPVAASMPQPKVDDQAGRAPVASTASPSNPLPSEK